MKTQRTDEVRGYKIDFVKNTLTLNYKFAAAANDYGSPEYKRLKAILEDFPDIAVVVEAGRKITTTRKNKRLTYENMEDYMEQFENSKELIQMFRKVRKMSRSLASPYKYVSDWFKLQFPKYKECPQEKLRAAATEEKKENLYAAPVEAPNTEEYKKKEAA